jgi:hypothetical protein
MSEPSLRAASRSPEIPGHAHVTLSGEVVAWLADPHGRAASPMLTASPASRCAMYTGIAERMMTPNATAFTMGSWLGREVGEDPDRQRLVRARGERRHHDLVERECEGQQCPGEQRRSD